TACCYASRCTAAQEKCLTIQPGLRSLSSPGHSAACFFPELAQSTARQRRTTEAWQTANAGSRIDALRMSAVSKSFSSAPGQFGRRGPLRQVLQSVDLSIKLGECVALVGESGAGKSTILRLAAGLLSPDSGQIFRIDDATPQIVFQDAIASLTPWLPIGVQI